MSRGQSRVASFDPWSIAVVMLVTLGLVACGGPGGDPPKNQSISPAIASISPNTGSASGGTSVVITGTNFNSGASVTFGGTQASTVTVVNSSRLETVTPAHASGAVTVEVRNPRGGGSASMANGFTYAGFSVSSVSPNTGPGAGGTTVTINGSNIQSGVTAFFDSTQATSVTFLNSTQVTAVTPARPGGGTVNLQLNNPDGGIATLTNAYTYQAPLTVSSISPNNGGTAGGTTVTINGTGFLSGATVTIGGVAGTSVTFISSTQLQAVTPPHAAGLVSVVVTNPGGASATLTNSFTYGNQPTVTSVSPNSGSTNGGTTVTINGSNFQSGVTVSFGGTNAASVTLVNSSQLTAVTPAHAAGEVNVAITNPGPLSSTLTNGFTYTSAPLISSISPISSPTTGGTSVTISGSNFLSGATVTFGGTSATSVVFVNSTQLTAVTPARAAGTVNVVVTNPGGQNATLTNGFTYAAGFAITSISPATGSTTGGTSVTVGGSGFLSGATVEFVAPGNTSGTPATNVVFVNSTQLTAVTPAFTQDTVDLRVVNPGGASTTLLGAFTFVSPLSLSSVSPNSGTTAGGTSVTLTGTGFVSGAIVTFGGIAATSVTFVNSTQLTAVTPAHTAGPVEVRAINSNGDFAPLADGYTYTAPPVITSVSPNNGSPAGGTVVIINGSAFVNGATATFGGTPATNVVFISSTQLQVTTPARPPGTITVSVKNPNGQNTSKVNAFTYNAVMSVTGISPGGGVSAGGETVTVTGTGFQTNTTVFFDLESAQSVTVVDSTQIQALTPPHATGVVDINVSTPDGQFDALIGAFEYSTGKSQITTPSVASVSPNSGVQNGSTPVTITGVNFVSGLTVSFGGTPAGSVNVVSGGQITCTAPPHAAGTVDVTVTNPDGGSDTLAASFTYIGLDLITISPQAADIVGGTVITLNGSGFQNGATVLMGGLVAISTFINSTQIQATAPVHAAGVVDVKITNPDGTNDTLPSSLTYTSPPGISSILPNSGLNTGGTSVTIKGLGFLNGATVKFGALAATSVTFVSLTELRVVTPAQAPGVVDVTVTNPDASSASRVGGFRYGTLLFQDGFEGGSFANFSFFSSTDVTINSNASFVKFGGKSAQIHYVICGDSTNTTCGASHQDRNRWFEKNFSPGLARLSVRGYVFMKTPEPGASALSSVQRKFYYIKAATGPAGTPNALWYVVLTSDTVNGKVGLRIIVSPKGGGPSYSLYGTDSELGTKTGIVGGIFELQFDRYYNIELEIGTKSGLGANDSVLRLWIDGTLQFQKTNTWTTGPCHAGGSVSCPAFPDDTVFPGTITRFEIGTQADRVNFQAVDEFRYWDNIGIADVFIGP